MKADDLSQEILSLTSEIWHELDPDERATVISLLVRIAYDNIKAEVRLKMEERHVNNQRGDSEDSGTS